MADIRLATELGLHAGDQAIKSILTVADTQEDERMKLMITVIGMAYVVHKLKGLEQFDPRLYKIADELVKALVVVKERKNG